MNDDDEHPTNTNIFPQFIPKPTIPYYKQIIPVQIHNFYINDEILEIDTYLDMINIIKTSNENDTCIININSCGGRLDTAVQIISAMRQSAATIVTTLEGLAASAATLIFLAADKHIVNPFSTFMIHNYSQSIGFSKGNELVLQVEYQKNFFKKLAKEIYGGFLTESEYEDLFDGKDYWFDTNEIIKRLKLRNKTIKKQKVNS